MVLIINDIEVSVYRIDFKKKCEQLEEERVLLKDFFIRGAFISQYPTGDSYLGLCKKRNPPDFLVALKSKNIDFDFTDLTDDILSLKLDVEELSDFKLDKAYYSFSDAIGYGYYLQGIPEFYITRKIKAGKSANIFEALTLNDIKSSTKPILIKSFTLNE